MAQELKQELKIEQGETGQRIDAWAAGRVEGLTRTHAQKLIEEGQITVNGQRVKPSYRLKPGDQVRVVIPPPAALEVKAQAIPLDVIYEDADLLVVNKPAGMVVHPAHGNYEGTLVNALLAHCRDLSGIGGVMRPGIVHRLDKDTSGLLVVAKNDLAHTALALQIKERKAKRRYLALVHGRLLPRQGKVEAPIGRHPADRKRMAVAEGGKPAVTYYRVLKEWKAFSLIEAALETGRTHQIRVHMAYIGHPVVGDRTYAARRPHLGLPGQALHAWQLEFWHPRSGEHLRFFAPLPQHFREVLRQLMQRG